MSLSQSQQYYLQSMGIDLYALRSGHLVEQEQRKDQEKDQAQEQQLEKAKSKPVQAPAKPLFKMKLSELTDARLIADICCVLKIKPSDIKQLDETSFRLGSLDWVFSAQGSDIAISENKLSSGKLTTLTTSKAKSALWASLLTVLPED